MDMPQETPKDAASDNGSSAAPEATIDMQTVMMDAFKKIAEAAHQRAQHQALVHGATSAVLESVLKIMEEERERLYQTGQTDCVDVRRNNGWLNTMFSGAGRVSYDDLCGIIDHWKDGVAARRQVGGFQ